MKADNIQFGLSYIDTGSWLHRLNGITKFLWFMAWIFAVLMTFDLRVIVLYVLFGLWLLRMTGIPFNTYRIMLLGTGVVLLINALFMYMLAPAHGAALLGSETILLALPGTYSITSENLFYLLTVTLKYFSMFPVALVFVFCTQPSEFSASLNRLGVPYKIAYAVSLTLRYLPDIQADFLNILHAQQARGADISGRVSLRQRLKNLVNILGPLLFSSLERADTVSNAMVLRGFGRARQRTWYCARPLSGADYIGMVFAVLLVAATAALRCAQGSTIWYPG